MRWSSFLIKRLSGVSPDGDAGGGVGRWQNRLRLDPPLEFLVQPLDYIGGTRCYSGGSRLRPDQQRKVEGWQTLATAPIDQPIDPAP